MDFEDAPRHGSSAAAEARRKRTEREEARQAATRDAERAELEKAAGARIARFLQGVLLGHRWREADWRSLQTQASDLQKLAGTMQQRGSVFLVPCKVLLPLLRRTLLQRRRRHAQPALSEVCGILGSAVVLGLRAPLSEAATSLCALFRGGEMAAAGPPSAGARAAPLLERTLLTFARLLLLEAPTSRATGGAPAAANVTALHPGVALAEVLEVSQWGSGEALRSHSPSQALVSQLLERLLSPADTGVAGLRLWRAAAPPFVPPCSRPDPLAAATAAAESAWWLARVAVQLMQLDSQFQHSQELLDTFLGVPGFGRLLAAAASPPAGQPALEWRQLLRSYYFTRLAGEKGSPGPQGAASGKDAIEREYNAVYVFGNLWEIHSLRPLPLEPLLQAQSLLAVFVDVSMLPGAPSQSVDEPQQLQRLRQQLRALVDRPAITALFGAVLSREASDPITVESLCAVYSILLQAAGRTVPSASVAAAAGLSAAAESGFRAQVFFTIASGLAFAPQLKLAHQLWHFAQDFYGWYQTREWQTDSCYRVLHLQAIVLGQLLQTSADAELRQESSPLFGFDFPGYIKGIVCLMARLVFYGELGKPDGAPEAFLQQVGRVLALLQSMSARHRLPHADDPELWHAPQEILNDVRRAPRLFDSREAPTGSGATAAAAVEAKAERLLRHVPYCLPFDLRVQLLHRALQGDRHRARERPGLRCVIRRTHLFEDGLAQLMARGNVDWKGRFHIAFVSEAGYQEQGQDAGGLFKEYWEKLAETAFNPDYGLFRQTSEGLLYPNPEAHKYHEHAQVLFKFLGMVVGKAIFEGIVIEPLFAPFFLTKLLGRRNFYYDLQSLDPTLFANLQQLKSYTGDVRDLCCSFVATAADGQELELVPNGRNMPVTNENRFRYIYMLSDHRLNTELQAASDAFVAGLRVLVDNRWLRMFGEGELQQVISGDNAGGGFDVDDLERHVNAVNCSGPKDKLLLNLWKALRAMDDVHRSLLLRFVTSCSRPPLLGFSHLSPPFSVHKVPVRKDSDLLPTASTCFNTLKLPTYSSWKVMRQKLEFVSELGAGFELS